MPCVLGPWASNTIISGRAYRNSLEIPSSTPNLLIEWAWVGVTFDSNLKKCVSVQCVPNVDMLIMYARSGSVFYWKIYTRAVIYINQ